jgi:hypothetical protein
VTDLAPSTPDGVTGGSARIILSSPGILPEEDQELLLAVMSQGGVHARVEAISARRGDLAVLTWIVLAVVPLQAFLSALGSKAADDGYAKLGALLKRLAAARHARPGKPAATQAATSSPKPLILRDSHTGLQIVLEADLPSDAYDLLIALDLSQFSIGPVHYDQARSRWRSELDEAAATSPSKRVTSLLLRLEQLIRALLCHVHTASTSLHNYAWPPCPERESVDDLESG